MNIGHNTLRMLQLCENEKGVGVLSSQEEKIGRNREAEDFDRHSFLVDTLRQMYSRGSFEGKEVVSCLSNNELIVKNFRMAVSDDKDIDSTVMQEASVRFDIDPSVDEVRYVVAGRIQQGEEQKDEIILFGVKHDVIKEHISIIEDAGFIPVGIDSVPLALLRSTMRATRRQADRQETRFFVDVGGEYTTVIVGREEGISFIKQIPVAGRKLNEAVAARLDITLDEASMLRGKLQKSDEDTLDRSMARAVLDAMRNVNDKLVQEISKCFRYHAVTFRGRSPKEIIIAGGAAYEGSLVDTLQSQLGIDVIAARPLVGYELGNSELKGRSREVLSEWSVAAGASIKNWKATGE